MFNFKPTLQVASLKTIIFFFIVFSFRIFFHNTLFYPNDWGRMRRLPRLSSSKDSRLLRSRLRLSIRRSLQNQTIIHNCFKNKIKNYELAWILYVHTIKGRRTFLYMYEICRLKKLCFPRTSFQVKSFGKSTRSNHLLIPPYQIMR